MARVSKPEEVAQKRNAILDAAQRLVFTKGFEETSIQDVLNELSISGGAFHHYFDSRAALLEALIERIQEESLKPILPIVNDPNLNAIEKLHGFFGALDQIRLERRKEVMAAGHIWYKDSNAVVRQKVDEAIIKQRAPILSEIVRQGVREGIFTNEYSEQAGEVIMSLLQGMGNAHAKMMLTLERDPDEQGWIKQIVDTYAAYMDAIERVLGAPHGSFSRIDTDALMIWVRAVKDEA